MEKQKMETTGVVEGNIDKVRALFPHCITEIKGADGKLRYAVDFDKLRVELGDDTVEGQRERYQFTWPQKSVASALANTPTRMTLRPDRDSSVDFDNTENLYIEGDNLEVLKVLRETYLGQVKMIYIDPPYNTGKDFVYKDRRYLSQQEMDEKEGKFDEYGNLLFTNSDSNGRFHTDWLNFIYPRLKVARDLLTDDGVIFISIDDREIDNLRKMMDELFGEENFIAQFIWEQGRKSMAAQVAVNHEYCIVYSKNKAFTIENDKLNPNENWREKKDGLEAIYSEYERLRSKWGADHEKIGKGMRQFYKNLPESNPSKRHSQYKCSDEKGLYFPGDIAQGTGNGGRFDILHPVTGKPCKLPKGGWRFGKEKLPQLLKENRIHFGEDETSVPCLKRYLKETEYEVVSSVFYKDGRGASKRLESLLGGAIFDFPKDEEIIQKFVSLTTSYETPDSIILDFFSGSATTAHAVMALNAEDGGKRKFIMVQLAELTPEDSEARKAGYKTICEIGEERIRRAGKKIKEEAGEKGKDLDIGFRVLKLDTSNMKDVFYNPAAVSQLTLDDMIDNVKEGRSDEDLLFQVMLQNNIPVSAKIEKISVNGHPAYVVDEGALIATFDRTLDDATLVELAKMEPMKFVMREPEERDGVNPDNLIDNFEQKFELYSPNTQRSIL